jgi:hypothetical protein
VVPPLFRLSVDWSVRLRIASGVERVGDGWVAIDDWRSPTELEQNLLAPVSFAEPLTSILPDCLCLFALPNHLYTRWRQLLETAAATAGKEWDGFDAFVGAVGEFLAFKEMPFPTDAAGELLLSQPGLRSLGAADGRTGLTFSVDSGLWAVVNLGEESTSIVYSNLPGDAVSRADAADHFAAANSDYPLVRLRIDPGEGVRLPAAGILMDGCTLDQDGPDVRLMIRAGGTIGRMC